MSTAPNLPAIIEPQNLPAVAAEIAAKAKGYAKQAKAENTRRAYAADWRAFQAWCDAHREQAMPAPATTLLAYLVDQAGILKVATLERRLSAIREAHRYAGHELETGHIGFRDVWRGIRRQHGAPAVQKAPLLTAALRGAVDVLPGTLAGCRDRASLLIGFASALRRSELAALEVTPRVGASGTVEQTPEGLIIHLMRSKTDQDGEGQTVAVPFGSNPSTCPVRAYSAWIEASQIKEGPVFRAIDRHGHLAVDALTDRSIALIVKRAVVTGETARGASEEEAQVTARKFAGHSLRAGLATSAAANGAAGHLIQKQLRHRKFETTARYIRSAELFKQNAAGQVGL
jgi:site-specific recombinase XerD